MKKIILILLSINFLFADHDLEMGILYQKLFTTKKEAQIGEKIWNKNMKDKELVKHVHLKLYDDADLLLNRYLNENKIGIMVIDPTLYFVNKKRIDENSKHTWIPTISNNTFEQYIIIKNKELSITFRDIDKKDISFKDEMGKIWFEYLYMKLNKRSSKKILSNLQSVKKQSKLIYNTFFNKNSLSIVRKSVYENMLEINPQIKNKVDILLESKPIFVTAIGVTSTYAGKELSDLLINTTNSINNDRTSNEFISYINIFEIIELEEDMLFELENFYKDYFRLKRKYK